MTRYQFEASADAAPHAAWCYQLLRTAQVHAPSGGWSTAICPEYILVNAMSADIKLSLI